MTLATLPEGYLHYLDKGYVGLVDVMGDDLSIANSARVSYNKQSELVDGELSKRDIRLLEFLWTEGHTSPFRHAVLSFEIYAPLMVARQHWKYAVASTFVDDQNGWNESSRRYITEQEEFYIPRASEWRSAPENSKQGSGKPIASILGYEFTEKLKAVTEAGIRDYEHALQAGIAPELARLFLPAYGMYVRYRWTVSLHGVLNFLQQRIPHDAQYEIQILAKRVRDLAEEKFPHSLAIVNGEIDEYFTHRQ
jgi:thymidylate synthase (FAD)